MQAANVPPGLDALLHVSCLFHKNLHVVFFIRNVVKMCTVAIFRFCTVVSYFFPGILDSRFLVVYENMQNFVFGQWLNFHYV